MTLTAHDLRKIADAMDAAAAMQQEIKFLKSENARLHAERNQWRAIATAHHSAMMNGSQNGLAKGIPDEIKKKMISCVHPDHCNSIHATTVSQWLLAQ